ncbi:MAG TPA: hypothetical protein VFX16_04190 [Pseudonocardiaceae bacterium]|nr:hypothetical protein [Pseudonocardiaceae bacterium]
MRIILAAAAALALLGLAGCSATTTGAATTSQLATTAAATPAHVAPAASTPDGSASRPYPFGATHHGQSLDLTVSKPKSFVPSDTAFADGAKGSAVEFTITMSNHANQAFNPLQELTVKATAGDSEASEIDDSANHIGEPDADLLPGHTLTWQHAVIVPSAARDLTVAIGTIAGDGAIYYSVPLA